MNGQNIRNAADPKLMLKREFAVRLSLASIDIEHNNFIRARRHLNHALILLDQLERIITKRSPRLIFMEDEDGNA